MTDSAGTPAEPDAPAGDEPSRAGAAAPAGAGAGAGAGTSSRKKRKRKPRPKPDAATAPGPARPRTGRRTAAAGGSTGTPGGPGGPDGPGGGPGGHGGGGSGGSGGSGGPGDGEAAPGDGHRTRRWPRWTALASSVVVLAAAGGGWWLYQKLDGNITTDSGAAAELERYEKERPASVARGARNILLIGSDTRAGRGNAAYGRDRGTERSDTTILVHLAANGRGATAVSVPRDLMVRVPSCRKRDGSRTVAQVAQFNWAFAQGGTACTIRTVEKLTGIRVDHHMVIDFRGFKDMVDAVGGVRVCVTDPIDDPQAHLRLRAGAQTLRGEQALGYVRARKSLGNGSDTERMDRQQQFLGALVNKVQSNGVLLNPTRLYPVLDAATKSLTTDPGLDSLRDLYDLARAMRSVPTEKVQFLTVPRRPYAGDPNRDELVQPMANSLFKRLRDDAPVVVVDKDRGSKEANEERSRGKQDGDPTSSPSATPTFAGTNAAVGRCE
ncbi:LCP family protein [Streptomyces sp. NPDC050856]|uniref:LCP family protein n=1 Tax=Streptomyces sp. NPDC050856 TaxID=3154939 RepID=UPI0033E536B7